MTDLVREDAMIFRLSEKLNAKIKAGTLATCPWTRTPLRTGRLGCSSSGARSTSS